MEGYVHGIHFSRVSDCRDCAYVCMWNTFYYDDSIGSIRVHCTRSVIDDNGVLAPAGIGGCRLFSLITPHLSLQFSLASGKEAVSGGALPNYHCTSDDTCLLVGLSSFSVYFTFFALMILLSKRRKSPRSFPPPFTTSKSTKPLPSANRFGLALRDGSSCSPIKQVSQAQQVQCSV